MIKPVQVDGWNVAHLAGGLLLSTTDFSVQFSKKSVDELIDIMNSGQEGHVRDADGRPVTIIPQRSFVVLVKANDKVYPGGIILPVDAFSEFDGDEPEKVTEGLEPAFKRVGNKIKRGFRVTSGHHKGQVVMNPETAHKPPVSGITHAKLRAAAKKNRFIRALKSKMTRKKSTSLKLRRLNHTD